MNFIPEWAVTYSGYAIAIVSIGWNAVNAFSSGFSKNEKLKDKTATELVELLQKTVDTLRTDFNALQDEYEKTKKEAAEAHLENSKEIGRLSGENATLTKLLQGRDENYLKFQATGLKAFEAIGEMAPAMNRLLVVMEKHCESTERWIENDARSQGKTKAPAKRRRTK